MKVSSLNDLLQASTTSDPVSPGPTGSNPNNLSNYFGTPQSSGDSIFDQLASPRSRATSESQGAGGGFTDITINTPVKRAPEPSKSPSPAAFFTPSPGQPPTNSTPHLAQGLTSTPTPAPCAPGQEAASPAEMIPVSLPVTQVTTMNNNLRKMEVSELSKYHDDAMVDFENPISMCYDGSGLGAAHNPVHRASDNTT